MEFKVGDWVHPPNTEWIGEIVAKDSKMYHVKWLKAPGVDNQYRVGQVQLVAIPGQKAGFLHYDLTLANYLQFEKNQSLLKKAMGIE